MNYLKINYIKLSKLKETSKNQLNFSEWNGFDEQLPTELVPNGPTLCHNQVNWLVFWILE